MDDQEKGNGQGMAASGLREAAQAAMARLQAGADIRPALFITGRDGRTHEVSVEVSSTQDERDVTLWAWLRAVECDAHAMLSVTVVNGRNAEDPPEKVRQYLMVASCTRGEDGNDYWASTSELVPGWRMLKEPIPVGEPACTTASMRALDETPTLYGFPEKRPSGPERAEARRRLEVATKRRNKGKRPFTDAVHDRIGW